MTSAASEMNDGPGSLNDGGSANDAVVVTTKNVTEAELAAITAVVRGMLAEEGESLRAERPRVRSQWERSQRDLRGEVNPAVRTWLG